MPFIRQVRPDALIIPDSIPDFEEVLSLHLPLIVFKALDRDTADMPVLVTNNTKSGELAAEHLLEHVFPSYAFCGYDEYYWSRDRCMGFCETISKAGYPTSVYARTQKKRLIWQDDQKLLIEWLNLLPKPVGVMTCNDERGLDLTIACKAAGIAVPEQVAIVGMDNDELVCQLSNPPLSSVRRRAKQAGFAAAELLDMMIAGKKPDTKHILVEPDCVIARQSTDIIAVDDPNVSAAIRFIRENADRNICVKDVVNATSLARTRLYKQFCSVLGRSISAEIRRVRINRVKELLRDTDLSASEITYRLSFSDVGNLMRYFRREVGMTLQEYRRKQGRRMRLEHL
jgi:LacI family transcriptional regulator